MGELFVIIAPIVIGAAFVFWLVSSILSLRRVVPTNEVHIVQTSGKTTSYGKDTDNGNTYYEWPSWLPVIGVLKTVLPVSVFDLDIEDYEAYDKGRLPFVIDVTAFFRVVDSNVAAQRVANFNELLVQLEAIIKGAMRSILASNELEEIMQGRSEYGDKFTAEVREQLKSWGVEPVKNIELMDIRDSDGSQVIRNIMDKKKSLIEMESRIEVAKNRKDADIAEVEARQVTEIRKQEANQMIGIRQADAEREVQLAKESANQSIKDQQKITKEKEMAVIQVEQTKTADIQKQVQLVIASQSKETSIILAEGDKQTMVTRAEGKLEAEKRDAEAITVKGQAAADAEKAMQLAPVEAQIVLAKEIGGNQGYQQYLVTIEQVKAARDVGMKQAEALSAADIKVISNSETPSAGLTNVMDLFSSKGGTKIGAMLEGLSNTDTGKALLNKAGLESEKTETVKH